MVKSELSGLVEKAILEYMTSSTQSFSEKSKIYSTFLQAKEIKEDINDAKKLLKKHRGHGVKKSLEELRDKSVKELEKINKEQKGLEEKLILPIVVNQEYKSKKIEIVLPINYSEIETSGLISHLYNEILSVSGKSEIFSYNSLAVIKTNESKLKKIIKKIKSIGKSKDFKKANVAFYDIDQSKLSLILERRKRGEETTGLLAIPSGVKKLVKLDTKIKKLSNYGKDIQVSEAMGILGITNLLRVQKYKNEGYLSSREKNEHHSLSVNNTLITKHVIDFVKDNCYSKEKITNILGISNGSVSHHVGKKLKYVKENGKQYFPKCDVEDYFITQYADKRKLSLKYASELMNVPEPDIRQAMKKLGIKPVSTSMKYGEKKLGRKTTRLTGQEYKLIKNTIFNYLK